MFNQYSVAADPALFPVLIAFLSDAGFDSFEETDAALLAFAPTERHEEWTQLLNDLSKDYRLTFSYSPVVARNWNEVWESQFHPIRIDDRLTIRASFHPADPAAAQELVIDPKMAFGTGHHATTHMMCELLFDYPPVGARVLDYGSGTGVLAILAKRLGAGRTDAVDIEAPSAESTTENARTNGVELATIVHGELHDVPAGRPYDLVLANINRNVILATAGALYDRLRPGGKVFFSGILDRDEQLLLDHLATLNFRHLETRTRADWRAFVFTRD